MPVNYGTAFTDEQILAALVLARDSGVKREDAPDKVQPPNLCAFLNNIPRPERDRLLDLAYPRPPRPARP